jgi:hypothetical protein
MNTAALKAWLKRWWSKVPIAVLIGFAIDKYTDQNYYWVWLSLLLAALLAPVCYLTSDIVLKSVPRRQWPQSKNAAKAAAARRRFLRKRFQFWSHQSAIVFVIWIPFTVAIWLTYQLDIKKRLESYTGELISANDPMPAYLQRLCGEFASDDAFYAFLGDSVYLTRHLPFDVIRVHHGDRAEGLLRLDSTNTGALAVTADFRSRDGNIITRLDADAFRVNPNNILPPPERPDPSTLKVSSQDGYIALNVRYLNKRAIRLTGVLRNKGHAIEITEAGILVRGMLLSGVCFEGSYGLE